MSTWARKFLEEDWPTGNMIQLSMFDPVVIPLTKGRSALVDPVDADLLQYKWFTGSAKDPSQYATRYITIEQGKRRNEHMHRVILERMIGRPLVKEEEVDHINGNGLDNRRANLRIATRAENTRNRSLPKNNTSGYKGVTWNKHDKCWIAQITVNGKHIRIGGFRTAKKAYLAYRKAAKRYFGKFARME